MDTIKTTPLPWELAFATELRRLRERADMSQYELARRASGAGLKFHQQQVNRIEQATRPVRLNEAIVLAKILGKDLPALMDAGFDNEAAHRYAEWAVSTYVTSTQIARNELEKLQFTMASSRKFSDEAMQTWKDFRSELKTKDVDTSLQYRYEYSKEVETLLRDTLEALDQIDKTARNASESSLP